MSVNELYDEYEYLTKGIARALNLEARMLELSMILSRVYTATIHMRPVQIQSRVKEARTAVAKMAKYNPEFQPYMENLYQVEQKMFSPDRGKQEMIKIMDYLNTQIQTFQQYRKVAVNRLREIDQTRKISLSITQ